MTDADVTEPASQHSDAEAPVPYRSGFVAVVDVRTSANRR